jgi:5-deoxy-glucuronate isomerase
MLMDFGSLLLTKDPGSAKWESGHGLERAFLLVDGEVSLTWRKTGDKKAEHYSAKRKSLLEESPTVLHVPASFAVSIEAFSAKAELYYFATDNARDFPAHLYSPEECQSEERGKGTMRETSTRIVRTVFDDTNAPLANLVLGEVVAAPGKWSSYPPHHHRQPEIYHYRFSPPQGFGLAAIGEEATLISNLDTVLIREGQIHPHCAAPGYAMWYIWVIRHLDEDRYRSPTFVPAHEWVTDPSAEIWAPPSERGNVRK